MKKYMLWGGVAVTGFVLWGTLVIALVTLMQERHAIAGYLATAANSRRVSVSASTDDWVDVQTKYVFKYKLTNGKTLVLEGNTPDLPDEMDVEQAANQKGVTLALANGLPQGWVEVPGTVITPTK